MTPVKIGGREIPLYFSTQEMLDIQEAIGCTALQIRDEVLGLEKIDIEGPDDPENYRMLVATDPQRMKKLGAVLRILGNAGLEENGQEPDLTDKWILRHIDPHTIVAYALIMMAEINGGNQSEVAAQAQKEEGPVDELVEEENRKKALQK